MDTATAARMSDPDRNRQFSRRWHEQSSPLLCTMYAPPKDPLGNFGHALLDAFRRKRSSAGGALIAGTGDPPQ